MAEYRIQADTRHPTVSSNGDDTLATAIRDKRGSQFTADDLISLQIKYRDPVTGELPRIVVQTVREAEPIALDLRPGKPIGIAAGQGMRGFSELQRP